ACGDQRRHDLVVTPRIVRPAVHEKDRRTRCLAVLLVGDIQCRRVHVLDGISNHRLFSRSCELRNRDYSGLAPDSLITLPHFAVSSARNLLKSAGEPGVGVAPKPARPAMTFGSARPALISLLSFSTMSAGVFFGAPKPPQALAS